MNNIPTQNIPTPFTDVYAQLLDSFRQMIPGAAPAKEVVVEKKAEVVAKQEWEDEGGAPKVVPSSGSRSGCCQTMNRWAAARQHPRSPGLRRERIRTELALPWARDRAVSS